MGHLFFCKDETNYNLITKILHLSPLPLLEKQYLCLDFHRRCDKNYEKYLNYSEKKLLEICTKCQLAENLEYNLQYKKTYILI